MRMRAHTRSRTRTPRPPRATGHAAAEEQSRRAGGGVHTPARCQRGIAGRRPAHVHGRQARAAMPAHLGAQPEEGGVGNDGEEHGVGRVVFLQVF